MPALEQPDNQKHADDRGKDQPGFDVDLAVQERTQALLQ